MSLVNTNTLIYSDTPYPFNWQYGFNTGIQSYYACQNSIFTTPRFQTPKIDLYETFNNALKLPNYNYSNYNLFNIDFNKTTNCKQNLPNGTLKELGYNSSKGQKLGKIAENNVVGFNGHCAANVRKSINQAGLGNGEYGNAHEYIYNLKRNPNFKEISTEGLNLKTLPAGCILVYDKGVAGYSKDYGHIEITDGHGSAHSDGTTNNIRAGAHVFIPV